MIKHINNFIEHTRRGGRKGAFWWLRKQWYRNVLSSEGGDHIFDSDWDLLVIIDGCAPEWIEAVSAEFDWLSWNEDGDTAISVGSSSFEWYKKSFSDSIDANWRDTGVITANPHAKKYMPGSLGLFEDVIEWGWDDDLGTVPAHSVTDAAIKHGRQTDLNRYIVHYMQPHFPIIRRKGDRANVEPADIESRRQWGGCYDAWYALMRGELSKPDVREMYLDNLRYVLPEVKILLDNFNAKIAIITADHSNALGQDGMYGHPGYVKLPVLRQVPWFKTMAEDMNSVEPDLNQKSSEVPNREEQLEALGYR